MRPLAAATASATRVVASIRLARMRAFSGSRHRPSHTLCAARWTTPSQVATTCCHGPWRHGSPWMSCTRGSSCPLARAASRERTSTSSPRSSKRAVSALPTPPVPPVTITRMPKDRTSPTICHPTRRGSEPCAFAGATGGLESEERGSACRGSALAARRAAVARPGATGATNARGTDPRRQVNATSVSNCAFGTLAADWSRGPRPKSENSPCVEISNTAGGAFMPPMSSPRPRRQARQPGEKRPPTGYPRARCSQPRKVTHPE